MYHKLNIAPDRTVYYRYNPDADVLAVRLTPEFGPATEEALPDQPDVTLSRHPQTGAALGLRVAGVQRLILDLLVRDVVMRAGTRLDLASPAKAGGTAAAAMPAARPAATPSPIAPASAPAQGRVAEPADGGEDRAPGRRRRRRRRGGTGAFAQAEGTHDTSTLDTADDVDFYAEAGSDAGAPHVATDAGDAETSRHAAATHTPLEDEAELGWDTEPPPAAGPTFEAPEAADVAHAPWDSLPVETSEPAAWEPHPAEPAATASSGAGDTWTVGASADDAVSATDDSGVGPSHTTDDDSASHPIEAADIDTVDAPGPIETTDIDTIDAHGPFEAAGADTIDVHNAFATADIDTADAHDDDAFEAADADAPDAADAPGGEPTRRRRRGGRRRRRTEAGPADAEGEPGEPGEQVYRFDAAVDDTADDDRDDTWDDRASHDTDWDTPARPAVFDDDLDRPGAADELETPEGFAPLGLEPRLGQAIAALGFEKPTPIQAEAVPAGLAGRDVIGLAQTGTGKTLAFVVPGLQRLLRSPDPRHRPRMLVLVPTRELAVQVAQETERLARFTDLRVATIYGGVGMGPQIRALQHAADVVVATPGRMLDHIRRGNAVLGGVEVLVMDEADRMLDMGFLPDVRTLIRNLSRERQTSLFTATMPPEIQSLSMEFQREPQIIEIARRRPPEQIEQVLYPVGKHLKPALLAHLLKTDPTMTSVLVFTERKVDADILARQLRQSGIPVALMHGDRRQVDRERALQQLRSGQSRVLVATNVAARGLDIDDISHVVNYDVPQTVDEYVHRIGRTARAEAEGKAYTFVTLGDETMVTRFEAALGRTLPRAEVEGFDYDVPAPNWAKPSAKDVMAMLDRHQSVVDRLRHLGRRR